MTVGQEDLPTLSEIARTLSDFRHEFRSQISQLVREDVYRAERSAMLSRLDALEKDHDRDEQERAQNRRLTLGAMLTCVGTIVATLILVAVAR